eukprot:SAG31_NODE_24320_length_484_cov_0.932468_1_plen_50_part_01
MSGPTMQLWIGTAVPVPKPFRYSVVGSWIRRRRTHPDTGVLILLLNLVAG